MQAISPMLAHTADGPFDSPHYLFEIKWDGIRALAHVEGDGRVRIQSREMVEITTQFPEVVKAFAEFPEGTVLDGELVVLVNGNPDRTKVLRRMSVLNPLRIGLLAEQCPATFVAFDLLHLGGKSWMARPLIERRARLLELVNDLSSAGLVASPAVVGRGLELFELVKASNLEGMMAKRLDGCYLVGRRSRLWVKILQSAQA